ncbi:3-hydroxyacyl-CoA dehydrogenase NAD-binding domain-containing protein [Gemmatimonas sp.]|jgi:3-hydroxybutyryl-CoA dehydrogenase|uniref:3-hydroxyacyl-CoA dehydrogenase NAD-binding domain-containing protein n=2 Tax=Gemmatimonas sp. TaxID=1962908 RepID=UPI0022BC63A4|nr:3-hydroxyacyl-CoA dehydrogenase NAD-binding domain-containing protein [Gemmatimonas sp.]MCE2953247.1 3-hydroxyacyl-CoA dehydrogenase NAD-binding domain-containing protein [Gemmatimonas sp.]MCZ8012533.1 3-hydroxyacyl-CoA dehydrogenase NAD-binding domain-containing protein [Gemmatimonas sp.]MCZ8268814.1 3-hydroxyacyl-CoA dehydrogenase NAD-binding domain-containing protein [Gemmatimonas sp.]
MAAATIGVVGAGAMGAGIAQVAAVHGHPVLLADALPAAMARARTGHQKAMAREVDKGRLSREAADAVLARLTYVEGVSAELLAAFAPCDLVIEAIVEKLDAKQALLRTLEGIVAPAAVLASNTSSLSIAALAGACTHKTRVVGVHFFNPAPVMPLVEIIPAISTAPDVTARATAYAAGWKKVTVLASDTPGFIVNRVARPFYGESLRLLEEGVADCATIDWALRTVGGFRMGPFELMDFIGHDVNFAVTRSVFDGMFHDPRYRPSLRQQRLLEAGWLGRKSGRGFYDYAEGAITPAPVEDPVLAQGIADRVLAMLVNEAVEAVHLGICTVADVELAMTTGVNYPRGLLAWGDEIGAATVLARLQALQYETGDDRYRPSVRLRRAVQAGVPLGDPRRYP